MSSPWTLLHGNKKHTKKFPSTTEQKKTFQFNSIMTCVCIGREKEYYVVHIARAKCHTPWKSFAYENTYMYIFEDALNLDILKWLLPFNRDTR